MKPKSRPRRITHRDTSWQKVHKWYEKEVGQEGHFFHKELILPYIKANVNLTDAKILDLGCGQGVLERFFDKPQKYTGVDLSKDLLDYASKNRKYPTSEFLRHDITLPIKSISADYTHAFCLLSLQNTKNPLGAIKNASTHLVKEGQLILILNHPCFRIPRQSSWHIDPQTKLQGRLINRYLTPLDIPIQSSPHKNRNNQMTWSYHHPLKDYFAFLKSNSFVVTSLDELSSPKKSQGKFKDMENRAREEFPLFMVIVAKKI